MKQSSIEWLMDKLFDPSSMVNEQLQWFEKAKAMHKEEIEKAWESGVDYRDNNGHGSTYLAIELGEQPNNYYNKTYNNENTNTTTD